MVAKQCLVSLTNGLRSRWIAGLDDVKSNGTNTSHPISDRFFQPLTCNDPVLPDLAAVHDAWPRLPEAVCVHPDAGQGRLGEAMRKVLARAHQGVRRLSLRGKNDPIAIERDEFCALQHS
jgi:hypothetical protein